MFMSVWFCVILATTCIAARSQIEPHPIDGVFNTDSTGLGTTGEKSVADIVPHYKAHDVPDHAYSVRKRRKRMVPIASLVKNIAKGMYALKAVLSGARPVRSSSHWYREYKKAGGYKQALNDFYSAGPHAIRDFTFPDGVYGKAGKVGDRTIMIRNGGATGNQPTLELIKKFKDRTIDKFRPSSELVDKITYTN